MDSSSGAAAKRRRNSRRASPAFRAKVLSIINKRAETKQYWSQWDETALTTLQAATFYDLTSISQGDNNGNRNGSQVRLNGFHFKGIVNNNSSSVTNYVRIVVFKSIHDNVDMTYSTSDLFAAANNNPVTLSDQTGLNAMYHPIDKRLHTVYKDIVVKLAPTTATDGSQTKMVSFWIPLKGLKVDYEGTGTGDGNCYPRVHFGMWAAEAPDDTSTGETVEFSGVGRMFFKDN